MAFSSRPKCAGPPTVTCGAENAAAQAGYMSDTPEYAEDVRVVFYISPEELDRAVAQFSDVCAGKLRTETGEARFFPVPQSESEGL